MSERSELPFEIAIDAMEKKHIEALKRAGWHMGYTYRARTEDSSFISTNKFCEICKEFHINPYEGDPRYVRINRPLQIAKNWAKHHNISVIIERRWAMIHHELGKRRSIPMGTDVNKVELLKSSNWEKVKTINP